jgi:chromosomal replication initiator protein
MDFSVSQETVGAWQDLVDADLVLFDDVHLLRVRYGEQEAVASECLVQLLDQRQCMDRPTVLTGNVSPGRQTRLSSRLRSRLGAGVNIELAPPYPESRLLLLQEFAQRRQLAVLPAVLRWLAEHLAGSIRELEGAIERLHGLTLQYQRVPDVQAVARDFQPDIEARILTVEKIARQVSASFRVEPRQLQSRRRFSRLQTPRQVGMYLARRLTDLSLGEIGSFFGGRDHSTVLHACRKIEGAMARDRGLYGMVRQLQSELTPNEKC